MAPLHKQNMPWDGKMKFPGNYILQSNAFSHICQEMAAFAWLIFRFFVILTRNGEISFFSVSNIIKRKQARQTAGLQKL